MPDQWNQLATPKTRTGRLWQGAAKIQATAVGTARVVQHSAEAAEAHVEMANHAPSKRSMT
eukprot:3335437-Prymnesium_polylepis.1